MADLELTCDLTKRQLSTSLDDLAPLVARDALTCRLGFTRNIAGTDTAAYPVIRSLQVFVGKSIAPPDAGKFELTTAKLDATPVVASGLDFAISDAALKTALANADWLAAVTADSPGCWILTTNLAESHAAPPDVTMTASTLTPEAMLLAPAYVEDGVWKIELRLLVMPLAFVDSFESQVGSAPNIVRARTGGVTDGIAINELQLLTIPADFGGLYSIARSFQRTAILGLSDGATNVETALNALYTDGVKRYAVTLKADNTLQIEFVGPLGGAAQDLLVANVESAPPGLPVFTLSLDRARLLAALRDLPSIALLFECVAYMLLDGQDPTDMTIPSRRVTLWQTTVTVARSAIVPQLTTIPSINWTRPPVHRQYGPPPTGDQLLVGTQATYRTIRGDGAVRSFACDHGLATSDIISVVVKDAAGNALLHGTDFTWQVISTATVHVNVATGAATPALNAWTIDISCSGPTTAYAAHTHNIADIIGLSDRLAAITAAITAIQVLLPTAPPSIAGTGTAPAFTITIPDRSEMLTGRWRSDFSPDAAQSKGTGLPRRAGILLPAVHVVSVNATTLSGVAPLPAASAHAGSVYVNNTANPIQLPGGPGVAPAIVPVGCYFASNGAAWYPVTRSGTTKSYYPSQFERTFGPFEINDGMLNAGQTINFQFALALATVHGDTDAQCILVIEHGAITESSVSPTDDNIDRITWNAAPLLRSVLTIGPALQSQVFGINVSRALGGTLTCSALAFGLWQASTSLSGITGTIAVTNGSTAVTGTGTTFTALTVGAMLHIGGTPCTIATITDNTHIVLTANFAGTTASGLTAQLVTAVAPAAAKFAMRARIIEFDTADNQPGNGWIYTKFSGAIVNGGTLPSAS